MVPAVAELLIPVGGELIISEFPRARDHKRNCSAAGSGGGNIRGQRKQVSAGSRAELIAFEIQNIEGHGVDGRPAVAVRRHQCRRLPVLGRNVRHAGRVNERPRRGAAALTGALVVHIEIAQFRLRTHRAIQIAADNILLNHHFFQKIIGGIERGVTEILPQIPMKTCGPAL